ncbi:MAG TPA: DUF3592 domain-containing protein [Acidobacteriaceae bacterium]
MNRFLHSFLQMLRGYDPRVLVSVVVVLAALPLIIWWIRLLRRPSAEEMERRRRERLGTMGRITDGHLLDARTLDGEESISPTPEVLLYSYRLAGVTYNCAQDVSLLPDRVRGYRLDQPLQVRYDPRNPGNSIVVAENWSGLWERRGNPRS